MILLRLFHRDPIAEAQARLAEDRAWRKKLLGDPYAKRRAAAKGERG